MSMLNEIQEQPDVIGRLLAANGASLGEIARLADGCSHVVVAARGTSDNAARYAQYVWGARNRLSVGLTTPSLFGPFDSPPALTNALVVGISQSGQSPDLVGVLQEASRQERPTLAITNQPDSPLGQQGDVVVDLCAGPERALAATKTYTAQLTAVTLISVALARGSLGELDDLAPAMDQALRSAESASGAVGGLVEADRCVVVGRGFHQSTVYEWALKLQELAYLLAQPFSTADFLHGPVAVIEAGFPLLAVLTAGPTYEESSALVGDMMRRGAHVVTLTDLDDAPGHEVIPVPRLVPWLSPIVAAPAVQRFAHALTVARGLDPESPRNLTKVTRTR